MRVKTKMLLKALGIVLGMVCANQSAMAISYYDAGEITIQHALTTENNPYAIANSFDGDFDVYNKRTNTLVFTDNYESNGTITFTRTFEPGVYEIRSSGSYQMSYSNGTESVDVRPFKGVITVLAKPAKTYQVVPTPGNIQCNTDFDIAWDTVDVNPDYVDKILFKIEERSAPIGDELADSWSVVANNYEGLLADGITNTHIELPHSKATQRQYQYRVSTAYVLYGHQTLYSEPTYSAVLTKPNCTDEQNFSDFTYVANGTNRLAVNTPNQYGISFNNINTFQVGDLLDIVNFSGGSSAAAKLIVINAQSVSIKGHLRVLGEPADLLILNSNSSSSSLFECIHCSFENINRLTLAQANDTLGLLPSNSRVGELWTNTFSKMTVDGLTAPGVLSLELFTGHLNLSGTVSTNLPASINSSTGLIELDYSGKLSIASGMFNAYIGGVGVDYNTLELKSLWPRNIDNPSDIDTSTASGHIEALGITFITSENLNLHSVLVTDADANGVGKYNGRLFIPKEGVKIESAGQYATLNIHSSIFSRNNIELFSRYKMDILNNLSSQNITLLSDADIHIGYGVSLLSDKLSVAAGKFDNQGTIRGVVVDISTENSLLNRFGGRILGRDINLASLSGVVRNGSLTPYRATVDSEYGQGSGQDYQYGTYYKTSSKGLSGEKVSELTAQIFGNRITIQSQRIENVNPYYRINRDDEDWSDGVTFSPRLEKQVAIYAAQNLTLNSSGVLLNSSAKLATIDPSSELHINAREFINERYRTELISDYTYLLGTQKSEEHDYLGKYYSATTLDQYLDIQPLIHSPPGSIYASGSSFITTGLGFRNNHSFVELVGNATFSALPGANPQVRTTGVVNNQYSAYKVDDPCGELKDNYAGPPTCVRTHYLSNRVRNIKTQDAMFIGHGDIFAPGINFVVGNDDALKNFVAEATNTSKYIIQDMSDDQFESFLDSMIGTISSFVESVKASVLNAWDSLINWFS